MLQIQDRLARLAQLVVAAEEYEPEALGQLDGDPGMSSSGGGMGGGKGGGGGEPASERAQNLATARGFLDEAALFGTEELLQRGVRLMTMHAAKGLEFEAVFVAGGWVGAARHTPA